MRDQRKKPRLEERHHITVMLLPENRAADDRIITLYHETDEVSADGLRFHSFKPIPVDSFLRIDVDLKPLHRVLALSGIVRWSHRTPGDLRYSVGVELLPLAADPDLQQWSAYVGGRLKALTENA